MRFIIKKMESEDEIKGKAFVHWKSWQEAYQGIVDSQYLAGMTLEQCIQTAYRWTDNILVAKDGDRVIGFAGYGKYRNAELEHAGEVYALYVLVEYYGKGAGTQLMNEALALLSDYPKTAVWVLKDNSRAIAFYEHFGFCFDGREEILELGAPVTAVRMIQQR